MNDKPLPPPDPALLMIPINVEAMRNLSFQHRCMLIGEYLSRLRRWSPR